MISYECMLSMNYWMGRKMYELVIWTVIGMVIMNTLSRLWTYMTIMNGRKMSLWINYVYCMIMTIGWTNFKLWLLYEYAWCIWANVNLNKYWIWKWIYEWHMPILNYWLIILKGMNGMILNMILLNLDGILFVTI